MKILEHIHTVKIEERGVTIRVWAVASDLRNEEEANLQRTEIRATAHSVPQDIADIAMALAELPFCNAVEVKRGDRGVLIYPDWP